MSQAVACSDVTVVRPSVRYERFASSTRTRATLWLCQPGKAPAPLPAPPLDRDALNRLRPEGQTERLLREASDAAARKARRAVGYGGRSQSAETDLQSAWRELSSQNGGRGPSHWTEPAQALGMTQQQAAQRFARSPEEVRHVYRSPPRPGQQARASRDAHDVWFMPVHEAEALFREQYAHAREATAPAWMTRAAERQARNQARTYREGGQ